MDLDAKHTCNPNRPGMPLPFGRKAESGVCVRCDDLREGAAPRSSWQSRARHDDERRAAEIRAHFASAKHRSGGCGTCTFGDW